MTKSHHSTNMKILALLLLSVSYQLVRSSPIIGGENVEIKDFPYVVSLRYKNNEHFCGAGIIAKNVIITAHHCITMKVSKIIVVSNTTSRKEINSDFTFEIDPQHVYNFNMKKWLDHSKHKDDSRHDIAIAKLNKDIPIGLGVQIATLPTQEPKQYLRPILAGWGLTEDPKGRKNVEDKNIKLKKLLFTIQNVQVCKDYAGKKHHYLDWYEMCGVGPDDTGSCDGDSGSPLIDNGILVGIQTAVTEPCGVKGKPDYFANVYHYLDFINYVLNDIKNSNPNP